MGTKKNQNSWEICTKHSLGDGVQFSDNCGITKPSRVKYVLNFDSASALITLTNSINRANCIIQKKKKEEKKTMYIIVAHFSTERNTAPPHLPIKQRLVCMMLYSTFCNMRPQIN